MASVFLSYDHDDATHAATIAAALEKSGHSVWWDRHIHGGAEYNSEIETAVEDADAVIVLWSKGSVRSPWVRDEAAEGRDRGKLVPVLLDQVKPPMGFRQFQTIDLTGWKPRQRLPKQDELLKAIGRMAAGPAPAQTAAAQPTRQGKHVKLPHLAMAIAAAGAAAIAITGVFVLKPSNSGTSAVAAVAPADTRPLSNEYARDLLGKLGRVQGSGGGQFSLAGDESRNAADFIFEVAAARDGDAVHANLVLRGSSSAILWSSDFDRPAAQSGDLRQQLGYTAEQVLKCATEAHDGGLAESGQPLRTYLRGCADMALSDSVEADKLADQFRQVVTSEPDFAAGWSKLILAELGLVEGDRRKVLEQDMAKARRLDPDMPAIALAEILLIPESNYAARLARADQAISKNPDDPLLYDTRASLLDGVGRNTDSVNDSREAANLANGSLYFRLNLVAALAAGGRIEAAFKELEEVARLWPGSSGVYQARYFLNARYGDPKVARQLGEAQNFTPSWSRAENYWKARENPTAANIETMLTQVREAFRTEPHIVLSHYISVLGSFHRDDELFQVLMKIPMEDAVGYRSQMFRPYTRTFWRNPLALQYAQRIGLLQFWRASGKWPDFCFEADFPYDCRKEAAKLLGQGA